MQRGSVRGKTQVMNSPNPYEAPSTISYADSREYGDVRLFSTKGRLGRVRYIGYLIGFSLLALILGSAAIGMIGAGFRVAPSGNFVVVFGLPYLLFYAVQILLTIQRCHDFNASGWLSLIVIIPLAGFLFWFIPGTDGANRWGHKTPPNTTATVVFTLLLPLLVVGALSAISISQYQAYANRAAEAPAKNR
jgi:uncharacterized membrane protein YhaH (DUF805 family)